ncbi:MAG: cytochrome b/b6 domain-containing protein [Limnochordaceae bacterium]|nr:cytochrome b/b6 domain-containing protein [Limnochordaceae bacterium]
MARPSRGARAQGTRAEEWYRRFTPWQVLEHAVLMVSFTGLALTGLAQKYASLRLSRWFIGAAGGIERVRTVHHVLGFVLLGLGVVHLLSVSIRALRYGPRTEMWPRVQDFRDLVHMLRYFMGLEQKPPAFGRYSYKEKFEYWAVVWGTVVMGLTGLMLMYPEVTTRYLPGVAVPAARAAHGGEAVLAVLAILIWHMYNAHLRREVFPMDPVIFTGRLPMWRMEEEHPLELRSFAGAATETPAIERLEPGISVDGEGGSVDGATVAPLEKGRARR